MMSITLIVTSIMLGVGLAMDAFSVSLANGLSEPCMKKRKMALVAGVFAVFQGLMPMIGWFCVHTIANYFAMFQKMIPWIALGLLGWIGGNMIREGIKSNPEDACHAVGLKALLVQGIATSIDALSVGFTIADYDWLSALICATLIASVTCVICFAGIAIGRKAGMKMAGKASILGGIILIAIGIEIFITNII